MKILTKTVIGLSAVAAVAAAGYYYRDEITDFLKKSDDSAADALKEAAAKTADTAAETIKEAADKAAE